MFLLNDTPTSKNNATKSDFKTFLQLISRNKISKIDLEVCSSHLYKIAKNEIKPEFNITDTTFDLMLNLGFSVSWDYKFNTSELKFNIEQLIQKHFDFEAPLTIINSDLFPLAQTALTNVTSLIIPKTLTAELKVITYVNLDWKSSGSNKYTWHSCIANRTPEIL